MVLTWSIFFVLPVLLVLQATHAAPQNVTVDDASTRISYHPPGAWTQGGAECHDCYAHIPPSIVEAEGVTWHEGLYSPDDGDPLSINEPMFLNFSFYGSAIYAYGILGTGRRGPDHFASLRFWIDGELEPTPFVYDPPGGREYDLDQLLYANTNLSLDDHTFVIQNGPTVGGRASTSLLLFDRLVYTEGSSTDEPGASGSSSPGIVGSTSSATQSRNIEAIVGGVIGALAFLVLLAILIWIWHRRRKHQPILWTRQRQRDLPRSEDRSFTLNPTAWFSSRHIKPAANPTPTVFNPEMMVSRGGNMASPAVIHAGTPDRSSLSRAAQPPSSSPRPDRPRMSANPSAQSRILAWQQQTAAAGPQDPRLSAHGPSDVLSSYWDHSTESYRSWEAAERSPPPPAPDSPPLAAGEYPPEKASVLPIPPPGPLPAMEDAVNHAIPPEKPSPSSPLPHTPPVPPVLPPGPSRRTTPRRLTFTVMNN